MKMENEEEKKQVLVELCYKYRVTQKKLWTFGDLLRPNKVLLELKATFIRKMIKKRI